MRTDEGDSGFSQFRERGFYDGEYSHWFFGFLNNDVWQVGRELPEEYKVSVLKHCEVSYETITATYQTWRLHETVQKVQNIPLFSASLRYKL